MTEVVITEVCWTEMGLRAPVSRLERGHGRGVVVSVHRSFMNDPGTMCVVEFSTSLIKIVFQNDCLCE